MLNNEFLYPVKRSSSHQRKVEERDRAVVVGNLKERRVMRKSLKTAQGHFLGRERERRRKTRRVSTP